MKVVPFVLVCVCLATGAAAQVSSDPHSACSVIDKARDSVFTSFERIEKDSSCKGRECEQVIVRLRNDSTCPIVITTADDGGFFEPLPSTASLLERIKRRPLGELPDGVFVSSMCYSVQRPGAATYNELGDVCGGDVRYEFRIAGGRSVQFGVSKKSIKANRSLYLPFSFAWEKAWETEGDRPHIIISGSVEHRVFIVIPDDVYRRMKG